MSFDELFMDRLPRGDDVSKEKKELEKAVAERLNQMMESNRQYMEQLFHELRTRPINVANVQVTNSQVFREPFLAAQLQPLLKNKLCTLEGFLLNVDEVARNFTKLGLVENMMISLNEAPRLFMRPSRTFDVIPVYNIVPVKRFYAKTGTNIGNGEGDGYIQFQFKNVFGGAESLVYDAITGTKTQSSHLINYSQPIFNRANYMFETTAYVNTRKLDLLKSEAFFRGINARVYTNYDRAINHEVIFENNWRLLKNVSSRSDEVLKQAGSNVKSSLMYNLRYDTRDSPHLPQSGQLYRIGLEFNGLFQFNKSPFFKTAVESQNTLRVNKHNSLIFTNKAGVLYPLTATSYLLDRFNVGGPNDVRSFNLHGVGPKQFNSSVGGDIFVKGGISLVSKLPRVSETSNFKFHTFLNYGKLIPLDKSHSIEQTINRLKDFSIGAGFGILYNHPMARIELNFVLPVAANESDYIRKGLQYGIGMSFL